jgi:hypothetical protein
MSQVYKSELKKSVHDFFSNGARFRNRALDLEQF